MPLQPQFPSPSSRSPPAPASQPSRSEGPKVPPRPTSQQPPAPLTSPGPASINKDTAGTRPWRIPARILVSEPQEGSALTRQMRNLRNGSQTWTGSLGYFSSLASHFILELCWTVSKGGEELRPRLEGKSLAQDLAARSGEIGVVTSSSGIFPKHLLLDSASPTPAL